jgi:hypothetical protein
MAFLAPASGYFQNSEIDKLVDSKGEPAPMVYLAPQRPL